MHDEKQCPRAVFTEHQMNPQRRLLTQIHRKLSQFEHHSTHIAGADIDHIDSRTHRFSCHDDAVDLDEGGPQGFVPRSHIVQGVPENLRIDLRFQGQRQSVACLRVRAGCAEQLPLTTLRRRQTHGLRTPRRRRQDRASTLRMRNDCRQLRNARCVEHVSNTDVHAERFTNATDQFHRSHRMAAEFEETVVDSDAR